MGSTILDLGAARLARSALPPITDEMLERVCFNSSHPWTLRMMESVRNQYLSQLSARRIGKTLGVSEGVILRSLRVMGVKIRPGGSQPSLSPEQKARAAQLLKKYSQREVAQMLGAGRHAVHQIAVLERNNAQKQVH